MHEFQSSLDKERGWSRGPVDGVNGCRRSFSSFSGLLFLLFFWSIVELYSALSSELAEWTFEGSPSSRLAETRRLENSYIHCIVLYLYICIALLEVHTNQKHF